MKTINTNDTTNTTKGKAMIITEYDFDFEATKANVKKKREALMKAFLEYEQALVDVTEEVEAFHKIQGKQE